MTVTAAEFVDAGETTVKATIDGTSMFVPATAQNRHYQEVLAWVLDGNTIEDADPTTPPSDGTLHVHTATAGSVTAHANADDLVVENSAACGISILGPNTSELMLAFGTPVQSDYGSIRYVASSLRMEFHNNGTTPFMSGTLNEVAIGALGGAGFNPDGTLHVHSATAGSISSQSYPANEVTIEGSSAGNVGLTMLGGDGVITAANPSNTAGQIIEMSMLGERSFRFYSDGVQRAMLSENASGSLMLGNANAPTYNLDVQATVNSNYLCNMQNDGSTSEHILRMNLSTSPDDNTSQFLLCTDSVAQRLRIWSDGDVQNHDNSYGAVSDRKLKQDEELAGSQWEDIKAIGGIIKKYKLKDKVATKGASAPRYLGVVAQDLEVISPGLVRDNPDLVEEEYQETDDDGNLIFDKVAKKFIDGVEIDRKHPDWFNTKYECTIEDSGEVDADGNPIMVEVPALYDVPRMAIRRVPKLDADGNPETTKSVKYSILYMKAVKALGEALEVIDDLKDRVETLEAAQ